MLLNKNTTLKPLSINFILGRGTYHILYKDANVLVAIPLDYEASKWLAYNTQWCTQTRIGFDYWIKTHYLLRVVFANGEKFKCNIRKNNKLEHDYSIWHSSYHMRPNEGLIGKCYDADNCLFVKEELELIEMFNKLPAFPLSKIHEFQLADSNF